MRSEGMDQCDGICRPPEFGSRPAPKDFEQHILSAHAHHERERAVAIVRKDPVVPGAQNQTRRGLHCFMPCTADLKENLILPL